jgi:hypothetical protein
MYRRQGIVTFWHKDIENLERVQTYLVKKVNKQ